MIRALAVFLFLAFTLSAQQTSITGQVTDASGGVLVGAKITISPKDGGASASTVSNSSGAFAVPALHAADYIVRAESPGFAPAERTLTLLVGQTLSLDL